VENSELNPFDRPALEAALQLKANHGGSVTAISMGPATSSAVLAEAQAMGVDRACLISDRALAESDTLVTARVLAKAVQRLGTFDLLFFGVRTSDSDTGQVGPQTAAVLKIPFVSGVNKITCSKNRWDVRRVMDDWQEHWRISLPAAMTIDGRAFDPRPVGLIGVSQVYDSPTIETWQLTDLDLTPEEVGLKGSPTRVARLQKVKRKRTCELLTGDPGDQVDTLINRLSQSGVMES
jgi:electron transfer flavoprotein beta subunit